MTESRLSQISQHSPDHDYFPKNIFRRSKDTTETPYSPVSPISERAAGKARAQAYTPLTQSQTQTPITPAFPSPVNPYSQEASQQQNKPPLQHQQFSFENEIPAQDRSRLSQAQTLLSDVPLGNHKHTDGYKHYSYSSTPEIKTAEQNDHEDRERRMVRARKLQKWDKYIGYVLGLISLSLATVMDGILAYVLHTFYKTRNIPAPGRTGPWAVGTQLWPAYMLLAASSITWLVDSGTLIAACWVLAAERKQKKEEKEKKDKKEKVPAARAESALVKAGYVAFLSKWFIIAVLYRTGKTGKDLWGWSCDTRAANIQQYYVNDLNFATLCRVQTAAWAMSLTEMTIRVLLMGFVFWLGYKLKKYRREQREEIKAEKMIEDDEERDSEVNDGTKRPRSVLVSSLLETAKAMGQGTRFE